MARPDVGPVFLAQDVRLGKLVGVKLFSAVAGIALVLAAIFFLRYTIDRGWLPPAVRVAIGVLVAVGAAGRLRAPRGAPLRVTANALDAAAVAILFATFFAAHALWQLIPSWLTFVLLALVTVLGRAALDPARVDFIAVLGPGRRLRHAGAAVDGREPADPAVRLPAAAQRRPGVGRRRERGRS